MISIRLLEELRYAVQSSSYLAAAARTASPQVGDNCHNVCRATVAWNQSATHISTGRTSSFQDVATNRYYGYKRPWNKRQSYRVFQRTLSMSSTAEDDIPLHRNDDVIGDKNHLTWSLTASRMRQISDDLLNPHTIVSVDEHEVWKSVEEVLRLWVTLPASAPNEAYDDVPGYSQTNEGVRYCFHLLDRFAAALPQEDFLFVSILETALLNAILAKWRTAALRENQTNLTLMTSQNNSRRPSSQRAWSKKYDSIWSPSVMAEKLERYRRSSLVQPDASSFNYVLHVMTKIEGVHVADQYLHSLLRASVQQEKAIQQAIGDTSDISTKATSLSRTMKNDSDSFDQNQRPLLPIADIVSVGTVIKGWVDARRPDKAQEWLDRIYSMSRHNPTSVTMSRLRPDAVIYTTVIHGWAQRGDAVQADAILQQQIDDYRQNFDPAIRPDRITFHGVLDAWAKAGTLGNPKSMGNNKTNAQNDDATERARSLVQQMEDFDSIIANGGDYTDESSKAAIYRHDSVTPNMETWSKLVALLGQSPNYGPEYAEKMLIEVEEKHGERASIILYNRILHGYGKLGQPERAEAFFLDRLMRRTSENVTYPSEVIVPDPITFNSIIAAWAAVAKHRPEAAWKCEEWLDRMSTEYGVTPSIYSYSTVLKAWSQSTGHYENAADQAEDLLRRMLGRGLDFSQKFDSNSITICYNTVLQAWYNQAMVLRKEQKNEKSNRAAIRAMHLLHDYLYPQPEMPLSSLHGRPTLRTLQIALHILAGSGLRTRHEEAKTVLKWMEEHGLQPTNDDLQLVNRLAPMKKGATSKRTSRNKPT